MRYLLILLLSGCAGMTLQEHEEKHCQGFVHQQVPAGGVPFRYEWKQTRPESVKPWLYVKVDDPNATCRALGTNFSKDGVIEACAQWQPINCIIILPN